MSAYFVTLSNTPKYNHNLSVTPSDPPFDFIISVVTCPPVPSVGHAAANSTLAVFFTIVKIQCDVNYRFPNDDRAVFITCTESAQWNVTEIPDCEGNKICWQYFVI